MEVGRAVALAPIRTIADLGRTEAEAFHQIGRSDIAQGPSQALAGNAVVAAADAGPRPLDALLLVGRTGKERARDLERTLDRILRDAVSGDHQKPDVLARVPHLVDDRGASLLASGGKLRDVDDRHFRVGIGDAITIRREVSRDFFTHDHLHLHALNERQLRRHRARSVSGPYNFVYQNLPNSNADDNPTGHFRQPGRFADAFSQSIIKG